MKNSFMGLALFLVPMAVAIATDVEPSEVEIRILQNRLSSMQSRMLDPAEMTERSRLQAELFEKIRRLHDNHRNEKDLVGEISSRKSSKPVAVESARYSREREEASKPAATPSQPVFKPRVEEDKPVAPMKISPPKPRLTDPTPQYVPPPANSSGSKDPLDVYRSIINYSTNSAPAKSNSR